MKKLLPAALLLAAAGLLAPVWGTDSEPPDEGAQQSVHAAGEEHAAGGEDHGGGGHASPVTPVLLGLVIIMIAAKIGGEIAERVSQPAVLGELVAGVILGNLVLLGYHGLDFLATNEGIAIIAEIGVVLLLFEVGLESNVREMMSVGMSSLLVAVLGVIAPFFLG